MRCFKKIIITLLVALILVVIFPYYILNNSHSEPDLDTSLFKAIGIVIAIIGVAIYSRVNWILNYFLGDYAEAAIEEMPFNKGAYQAMRNPFYFAVFMVLFGEAVFFGSMTLVLYSLLVFVIANVFVIYCEEPFFKSKFGKEYEEYLNNTTRWFPKKSRKKSKKK
jgi:protein-S-isoprenylcysteine O-methyltransferase Ste14